MSMHIKGFSLSSCFRAFGFWAILLLYSGSAIAQGQIENIGSDGLLGKRQLDSTFVNKMVKKGDSLRSIQADSAFAAYNQALDYAEEIDFASGKAYSLKGLGLIRWSQGNFDEAESYFMQSLEIFIGISDTTGIANLQSNLGAVYLTTGDEPRALEYLIKAVQNAEVVRDTLRMGSAFLNMGSIYSNEAETFDKAEENYLLAIEMFKGLNSEEQFAIKMEGQAIAAANLGELLLNRDMPEDALPYLEKSLEAYTEINGDIAAPLNFLGRAHADLKEYGKAEEFHLQALDAAREQENQFQETRAYIGLGDVYLARSASRTAVDYYLKGLELATKIKVLYEKQKALEGLAEATSALGNFRKAFAYQQRYTEVTDSLRSEEYKDVISKLQVQFDSERKDRQIELLNTENELNTVQIEKDAKAKQLLLVILALFLAIIAGFIFQYFYIRKTNKRLAFERNRSEQILLNILPKETADELKQHGFIKAKEFDKVTVMFTDFKAFSVIAERISAERLVKSVDYYFKNFDAIIEDHGLEKIKTIGDAYMCAGGLPTENHTHAQDAFMAAMEILKFTKQTELNPPKGIYPFKIRLGLNTGPVVAGVVGTKKFAYDIWGSTVNFAARMESNSEPGKINVSENTFELLKDQYDFTYRGEVEVKNKQVLKMYYANFDAATDA